MNAPTNRSQPIRYFVAFSYPGGHGNTQVDLAKPIRSHADVLYVEKLLRDASGQTVLSVTNWQRFED